MIIQILKLLISEMFPIVAATTVSSILFYAASGCLRYRFFPFLSDRMFQELKQYDKEKRRMLLRSACEKAFTFWYSFAPILTFGFVAILGMAAISTLSTVGASSAIWVTVPSGTLIFLFGFWIARKLTMKRVRPFLEEELNKLSTIKTPGSQN